MSNLSIRVVFQTQFRENYGAHNWDGEGIFLSLEVQPELPISSLRLRRNADSEWWEDVSFCISHSSEYSAEYIISETVVDAIDFLESDHVEEWEEPIYN